MAKLSIGVLMKLAEEDQLKTTLPINKKYILNKITASFIHLAGLDTYPIYPDLARDEIKVILSKVNGVLLPGGKTNVTKSNPESNAARPLVYSRYAKVVKIILEEAKNINDNGEYFPVFGICLGFQSMIAAVADDINIVEERDVGLGYNATLQYTNEILGSRLLSSIPGYLIDYMENVKSTHNYHNYMVDYDTFKSNPHLAKTFKVLSLSRSKDETISFISMIEGVKYPFYGFQFHPEFAIQTYYPEAIVNYPNKNVAAEISRNIMGFIREEASKNSHVVNEADNEKFLTNNQEPLVFEAKHNLPYYALD